MTEQPFDFCMSTLDALSLSSVILGVNFIEMKIADGRMKKRKHVCRGGLLSVILKSKC